MSESKSSRWARRSGLTVLLLSAGLWGLTTVFFIGVWDHVAAITTFPQWSWALLGSLGTMVAWRLLGKRNRLPALLLLLWLLATLVFSDNLRPVVRGVLHGSAPAKTARGTIRIITLNCASSADAAGEVMAFHPDVVLLQESPPSNEVARLAREWFGERAAFVIGVDCAIVSPHPLKVIEEPPAFAAGISARPARMASHYTRAILEMSETNRFLVTSLRLTPPLGSMDLWSPATWRAYLEDRRLRKRQLQSVLEARAPAPGFPEVLGGDFNAPAGDGIYRLLTQFAMRIG